MALHNPREDALTALFNLQRREPRLSAPRRPSSIDRNPAKVAALRAFLGIPGQDVGDISQVEYEEAATDVERRHREEAEAKALPAIVAETIRGQYGVRAAGVRAQAAGEERREQQARQHEFQAGQAELNRAAMGERQRTALGGPVVPTLDPQTGLSVWASRGEAAGRRTAGSATEREAIQTGQNTLDNIDQLITMGDEIGWKGIGPTGGLKNLQYKLLGIGSQAEDDFRVELQKIRADIMFGSGGKQLTTSEQKVAAGYLSDIYTNPSAARSRMAQVREILARAQARRTGQVPPTESDEWEDIAPGPR